MMICAARRRPNNFKGMAQLFDAAYYLAANPDVAKAIEEGRMSSAWRHFVNWGFREERTGVPDEVRNQVRAVMEASLILPPVNLISRVHGTPDAAGFEQVGKTIALDIYLAVHAVLSLDKPLRILDFGCGCGRVLRSMSEIAPLATIEGSDIDEQAIGWCRETFREEVRHGRFHFTVNLDAPPIAFPTDTFDLIYVVSVFTHLPEDLQLKWLGELERIAKPGAILAMSTSGDRLIRKHLTEENSRLLDEKGFYYFPYGSTEGLPDYYQAAWHTPSYIAKVWSKYFEILEHIPAGIAGHQDLVLCRKR